MLPNTHRPVTTSRRSDGRRTDDARHWPSRHRSHTLRAGDPTAPLVAPGILDPPGTPSDDGLENRDRPFWHCRRGQIACLRLCLAGLCGRECHGRTTGIGSHRFGVRDDIRETRPSPLHRLHPLQAGDPAASAIVRGRLDPLDTTSDDGLESGDCPFWPCWRGQIAPLRLCLAGIRGWKHHRMTAGAGMGSYRFDARNDIRETRPSPLRRLRPFQAGDPAASAIVRGILDPPDTPSDDGLESGDRPFRHCRRGQIASLLLCLAGLCGRECHRRTTVIGSHRFGVRDDIRETRPPHLHRLHPLQAGDPAAPTIVRGKPRWPDRVLAWGIQPYEKVPFSAYR